ncbi:MAG: glycoside hydrolase family 2 protein [Bacteroidales bacterium]|nr:glycoside hydrolase family 2 protein [Bacteroidales bacterium]
MRNLICIVLVFLISCSTEEKPLIEKVFLNDGWEFHQLNPDQPTWYPAIIPGTIHTDLLKNGLINNPFYGCNEKELQWIGETDWTYRKTFQMDNEFISRPNMLLIFEGLDTYAEVFLNGQKILSANNMFRKWEVDCKSFLIEGENLLEINFESAENRFIRDSLALGYPLPGGKWVFARKAAYHFGWDWGPKLVTAGIWKPVYLETWNDHRPVEIQLFTGEITRKKAEINTEIFVNSAISEKATLTVTKTTTGKRLARKEIFLSPDLRKYVLDFSIHDPILWWTNGLGEPHLYELDFELKTGSGFTWSRHIAYGIRKVEVVNENDEYGQSLYVKLNGVPVFMKGANYIPQHSFVTEVSDDDYRKVIQTAVESNMNMLRVWGGGIYEKDIFYEHCSRNGILVWQDFMFACAMYPGDADYIENVKQEAVRQIRRLRNHTSLAMWCGNNEADEGWHNWQWQKTHNILSNDSATIWQGYRNIFHKLLPETVAANDPGRFYLHTSPMHGWGRAESLTHGSAHYWGVWWGREPFEKYLDKIPRFMSEFGFQAMPALATIRQFQAEEDDFLFSDALKCHQKHPTGYPTIDVYLEREHLNPKSLDEYIYFSQLVQAKGIGMAIEAQRRAMPYCMGSLYWQLNDCWPVTSWSGTDVNGNRKALQYKVKENYQDILVSILMHNDTSSIYLVSDRLEATEGKLQLMVFDFHGSKIWSYERGINIAANSSSQVVSFSMKSLLGGNEATKCFLKATFSDGNDTYQSIQFFRNYGQLVLPEPELKFEVVQLEDEFEIELKATEFVPFVHLYLTEGNAIFNKNFIHLMPGEKYRVTCQCKLNPDEFRKQLRVKGLGDYLAGTN